MTSGDKSVRGWGIGFLATVDPFNAQSLDTIAKLTTDADSWVALNALGQIHVFGPKARDHLPLLKKIGEGGIERNAKAATKAGASIEAACAATEAAKFTRRQELFREQSRTAQAFIDRRRGL